MLLIQKFHIIYTVSFIYIIWFLVVLPGHPSKESLLLSKENSLVAPSPSTVIFSVVFIGVLIDHKCEHSFGSLISLEILSWAFVLSQYIIRGNRCPSPFSMWWWKMSGIGLGYTATSAAWLGHSVAELKFMNNAEEKTGGGRRWWRATRRSPRKRSPDLTPEPWPQQHHGRGGGSPKGETARGNYHSIGGNNCRLRCHQCAKGKILSRHRWCVLLTLLLPLISGDGFGATVDGGGGRRAKVNSSDPPRIGRCQQHGAKGKTAIIVFIVLPLVFVGMGKAGGEAPNMNRILFPPQNWHMFPCGWYLIIP